MERWLEAERDQLFLWLPVALGAGAAGWFVLPGRRDWVALMLLALGVASAAAASWRGGRAAPFAAMLGLAVATGTGLAWARGDRVAAPTLDRAAVVRLAGMVEKVEPLPARGLVRVTLGALRWERRPRRVPLHVRVSLPQRAVPATLGAGATMMLRARLMPPAPPAVPGAYDAKRAAWFDGVGASGRGFEPVALRGLGAPGVRDRLTAHITAALPGSAGGIAAALVTGDMGAIEDSDSLAMRRAGLAHLLSVSGLHITATVGIVMAAVLRLLALSRRLALTGRLPLVAAGAGAGAAIGYTWLTGSQVPTIRSCVAALMVLAALALGREALTLRLVAMGALLVLLAWPEAVVGPSFQLSFAAVASIVALHEHPRVRAALLARDEPWPRKWLREAVSLLVTGAVVELALMPIAVFYFHQAGAYGAIANIVAIPLTTFAIMPSVALALLLDSVGCGAPAWWLAVRPPGGWRGARSRCCCGSRTRSPRCPARFARSRGCRSAPSPRWWPAACGSRYGGRGGAISGWRRLSSGRPGRSRRPRPTCSSRGTDAISRCVRPTAASRCCATARVAMSATRSRRTAGSTACRGCSANRAKHAAIAISAGGSAASRDAGGACWRRAAAIWCRRPGWRRYVPAPTWW